MPERSHLLLGATGAAAALGACLLLLRARRAANAPAVDPWKATLEAVLPAIVVIRMNYVKSFDGDAACASTATGFVVDAARGIVLSNRHVVGTGPMRAECTFNNKEEVTLIPIYRDPIHDFGFFKFDPSQVRVRASHGPTPIKALFKASVSLAASSTRRFHPS